MNPLDSYNIYRLVAYPSHTLTNSLILSFREMCHSLQVASNRVSFLWWHIHTHTHTNMSIYVCTAWINFRINIDPNFKIRLIPFSVNDPPNRICVCFCPSTTCLRIYIDSIMLDNYCQQRIYNVNNRKPHFIIDSLISKCLIIF